MSKIIHVNPYQSVLAAAEASVQAQWEAHTPLTRQQLGGLRDVLQVVDSSGRHTVAIPVDGDRNTMWEQRTTIVRPPELIAVTNILADATRDRQLPRLRNPDGRLLIFVPKVVHAMPKRRCGNCDRLYTIDEFRQFTDRHGKRRHHTWCVHCERVNAAARKRVG
jgi:hypothetical protein